MGMGLEVVVAAGQGWEAEVGSNSGESDGKDGGEVAGGLGREEGR